MIFALILIAALITSAIAACALTAWALNRLSIRRMTADLRRILHSKTNASLRLACPNRPLESLAAEVNRALAELQETKARGKRAMDQHRRDLANISHDLRTPLTSVIGYLELLESGDLSPQEKQEYGAILLSRAKALERLIEGLYELSRLESGEYNFTLGPVNLQKLLCETLASFYHDFTARGIEPAAEIDEKAAPALADAEAARRVFTNLISNVLKHDGTNFAVSLRREGDHLVTAFANDAPHLTQEDLPHLFERFYSADRMRSGRNTGLGLAIVRELAEGMRACARADLDHGRLRIEIVWQLCR